MELTPLWEVIPSLFPGGMVRILDFPDWCQLSFAALRYMIVKIDVAAAILTIERVTN
jgi:hypothetical protein